MLQRNNSAANKPSKSRCNHHCSVIQRFLLKHSLLKNLTGKPFSKDTAPYKDCLQLLKNAILLVLHSFSTNADMQTSFYSESLFEKPTKYKY
jgi:hypothetical protein